MKLDRRWIAVALGYAIIVWMMYANYGWSGAFLTALFLALGFYAGWLTREDFYRDSH